MLRALPEQAQRDFLADKLAPRLEAACKDPEFKNNDLCHRADQEIDEFLESHQPQGQYDPKAFFLKDDQGIYQFMDGATREDLTKWRAIIAREPDKGCNLANIQYIHSRLELWRDQKDLAGLEKDLSLV